MRIGILGGTGPAGRGFAARLASAHVEVLLGSRSIERAEETIKALATRWPEVDVQGLVLPVPNERAAEAEVVLVATPWEGAAPTVAGLAGTLAGRVVVSMVNAIARIGDELQPLFLPRGSIAVALQTAAPGALVAAAFHHLPARELAQIDQPLRADVLVCSDHPEAADRTAEVARLVPGLRPLQAGSLSVAGALESMTAVVLNLNLRYKCRSSLRITGIDEGDERP